MVIISFTRNIVFFLASPIVKIFYRVYKNNIDWDLKVKESKTMSAKQLIELREWRAKYESKESKNKNCIS